ncbi:MAG: hypothetical protein PWQ96_1056 [Clostridia bacterium]|jgi:hypothetical protein|nr:hypothetical protein [Clostridiales bacterium]MDK2985414.1 hypothetical protein [Clostridia bacterium]
MENIVMGIQVGNRFEDATQVQQILTEYGCIIRTRLGLHQMMEDDDHCTEKGLILLELMQNSGSKSQELENKLSEVNGVKVRKMVF